MFHNSKRIYPRYTRPICLASILMLSLSTAACANSEKNANSEKTSGGSGSQTYTIGVLVPLTGIHAADGPVTRDGVDLAVEKIKTSGVLGDDTLKTQFADNQAAPDVAVSAFNALLSIHKPVASLTGFSGPTLAIAPIATRSKVVLVNTGGVTPGLATASPYLFNAVPLVDQQARVLMSYVAEKTDSKRVALLYTNDALGNGTEAKFGDAVTGAGLTYAGSVAFDGTGTDYRAAISKIQSLKPDVVYLTPSSDQAGNIIKQAAEIGFTPRWAGYSGFAHSGTYTIGGKAAEGGLVTVPSTVQPSSGDEYPAFTTFSKAWKAKYGTEPDYLGETAYEAVIMLAYAIAKAKRAGDVTGESVREAMFGLNNYPSIFGAKVDDKGHIFQALAVEEIKNSKFVVSKVYGSDELAKIG